MNVRNRLEWLRDLTRITSLALRHPVEAWDRLRGKLERLVDRFLRPDGEPFSSYAPDDAWRKRLHSDLQVHWPCAELKNFRSVWSALSKDLIGGGVSPGTGPDADAALAEAMWCIVRHTRPSRVVETGVARGVTTRVILEALVLNRMGTLWSIDLPPLHGPSYGEVGLAVPSHLRSRWQYLRGDSKRCLPKLLDTLTSIDVFLHDSLHTEKRMGLEISTASASLRVGGALVVDDIDGNHAFRHVLEAKTVWKTGLVARHLNKDGLFGVSIKR